MKWKNFAADTSTHFITATISGWRPLFSHEPARQILFDDWDFYRKKYNGRICAYVIMPEHYHLILDLDRPEDLHAWLRDVQGHSSKVLARWLKDSELYPASGSMRIWKEQARAVAIVTEHVLRTKVDYIHANPVRRGLVTSPDQWEYSSWRSYSGDDDEIFTVNRFDGISL